VAPAGWRCAWRQLRGRPYRLGVESPAVERYAVGADGYLRGACGLGRWLRWRAGPPVRFGSVRRYCHPADAYCRLSWATELGLRRGVALCTGRNLWHAGTIAPVGRYRPWFGYAGVSGCGLQPFWARGKLPGRARAGIFPT